MGKKNKKKKNRDEVNRAEVIEKQGGSPHRPEIRRKRPAQQSRADESIGDGKNEEQQSKKRKESKAEPRFFESTVTNKHRSSRAYSVPDAACQQAGPTSLVHGGQKLTALQNRMRLKLEGAKFRLLNEQLYTSRGDEAFEKFKADPSLFDIYHRGYRDQVQKWPENPLHVIISWLKQLKVAPPPQEQPSEEENVGAGQDTKKSKKKKKKKLKKEALVVADFGCGDAVLAQSLASQPTGSKASTFSADSSGGQGGGGGVGGGGDDSASPRSSSSSSSNSFVVHSFDLVARNPLVTACDMAKVPLPPSSVDVCVFCLSLMGTNLADYLREAHRVLRKPYGLLKVAEVRSRLDGMPGGLNAFISQVSSLGFRCTHRDKSNTMFVLLQFSLSSAPTSTTGDHAGITAGAVSAPPEGGDTEHQAANKSKRQKGGKRPRKQSQDSGSGDGGNRVAPRPGEITIAPKPCIYKRR